MKVDVVQANYYILCFIPSFDLCNGTAELSMTMSRLAVFYKQRDFYFYSTCTYSIPASILKLPISIVDAFLWMALAYYVIGYSLN